MAKNYNITAFSRNAKQTALIVHFRLENVQFQI